MYGHLNRVEPVVANPARGYLNKENQFYLCTYVYCVYVRVFVASVSACICSHMCMCVCVYIVSVSDMCMCVCVHGFLLPLTLITFATTLHEENEQNSLFSQDLHTYLYSAHTYVKEVVFRMSVGGGGSASV